jgi:hypothetical protein
MENSAILQTSWQRAQFLFDPHGEGLDSIRRSTWSSEREPRKVQLVMLDMSKRSTNNEFIVDMEKCIINGHVLLVYNCSGVVDPLLLPLIEFSGSTDVQSRAINRKHFFFFCALIRLNVRAKE